MVCYNKFKTSDTVLNSIYHEIKYFYLRGFAYRVELNKVLDMAKIIAQIEIFDRKSESYETDIKNYVEDIKKKMLDLFPFTHVNKNKISYDKIVGFMAELSKYLMDNIKNQDA